MFRFLVVLLAPACGLFAADPGLLNLVMPDAKVVAGVNVTSAEASPLGQFLLAKISADDVHLQKLISLTGFDPRIDLKELLLASNADTAAPGSLLLARGTFNVNEISSAAAGMPQAKIETSNGYPLIVFTDAKTTRTRAVAFIGSTIAVAGPVDAVTEALGRSASTTPAFNAALLGQVSQISATEDEWVVSSVSPTALIPTGQNPNGGQPSGAAVPRAAAGFNASLKNIQSFSGGLKFGPNDVLTAQINAADEQSAAALANVLKFAVSLISMNGQKSSAGAEFAQILGNVQISVNGIAVGVLSSVPDAEVQTLLSTLPVHKKAN